MATNKIKKGDTVKVITGKDKGKEGKVLEIVKGKVITGKDGKVVRTEENKVLVEGINMITKHAKASQANPKGGIIQKEAPISVSNVMYVHKGQVARIQFKVEDGKKVRYAKVNGKEAEAIK